MSFIQALILAVIQGLTEFLPVSSSGHLAFFGKVAGLNEPDINFDILLHLATLMAVLIYYRKDLLDLTVSLFTQKENDGFAKNPVRFLMFVIITSIPTAVIGLLLEDRMAFLHSNLNIVGTCFLITAGALLLATRFQKGHTGKDLLSLPWTVPLLIGIAQGIAVFPGISRSGATIVTALLLGTLAKQAASYSFLVSIPAIGGAFLLKLDEFSGAIFSLNNMVGFIAAFIVGLAAIRLVVSFVENTRLHLFAYYLFIIGIVSFFL